MENPGWLAEVRIRNAEEQDLPALEWEGEYIHFRGLYQQVFERSQEGQAVIWLAEQAEIGLLGQLFVQLNSGRNELADGIQRGYIYGFRVKPPYRNSGLGTLLLQNAEMDLRIRMFSWVTLNVARDNKAAMAFYQRRGYRIVGAEPGKWSYTDHEGSRREVHEPAWRMEKCICADVNKK